MTEKGGEMEAALPLNSPVTLVVKTPNQRHEDVQVDCEIGWTVQKLKTHLSDVYPTKPESRHQRIIYSGQLLNDELKLKDILREHEEGRAHTVHLVCTMLGEGSSSHQRKQSSITPTSNVIAPSSSQSTSTPSSPTATSSASDGLRYRGQTTPPTPPYYMYNAQMMNAAAQATRQGGYYPMMVPPHWMQQMYTQQMMAAGRVVPPGFMYPPPNFPIPQMPAQWVPQPANVQVPPVSPVPVPQVNQPAPPQPQQAVAAAAQPAEQDVRMNANGRPLLDEEEDDENANNDWLDKIYTMCRLVILLSIVWFYSSTGRFVLMIVSFALIYLYQSGFLHRLFMIRRNRDNLREEVHVPPPPQQPREQGEQPTEAQQDDENVANENGEEENEEIDGSNTSSENNEQSTPSPPPPGPSAIHVAFNFVTTFFTSLIPQGPPPPVVN